jgi:uncharacterized membrane protein
MRLISSVRQVLASRTFLLLFSSLLIIYLSIAYVASEPRPQERFLSISTLGSNMMAGHYYPSNSSLIDTGFDVSWYLNVYNRMGNPEYLSIRVKLINSTQTAPDDNLHLPSPENHIIELRHMLANDSTWVTPLSWTITEIDKKQDYVVIKGLKINDLEFDDLHIASSDGDFRLIFELWRYDTETNDFSFTWSSGLDERSTWNQIWFSVIPRT